jgi:uncharacterized peroxidase-related enzyme
MTFIPMIPDDEADEELSAVLGAISNSRGDVGNIFRVQSLDPPALTAHFELYKTLMFGPSDLSRVQREMIAVVVSSLNECHY